MLLRRPKKMEPTTGIEPVNLFLTKEALYRLSYVGRKCNLVMVTPEPCSRKRFNKKVKALAWSGRRDSNSRHPAWKAGALPTELLPLACLSNKTCSLHPTYMVVVVGGGFEPPKAWPADLQSAPFDHSGTPPFFVFGASGGTRTPDPLITNQ